MKKTIAMLVALVMVMSMCVSLSACGDNKDDYVGVWRRAAPNDSWFVYIYKDGTGDSYCPVPGIYFGHQNAFTWEVEDGYFVKIGSLAGATQISKYTLSGNQLLDSQGKVYATKYSSDTSIDVSLD